MWVAKEKREGVKRVRAGAARLARVALSSPSRAHAAVIEKARAAGLLEGDGSEHAVLTSDRDHYDLLQQFCPEARFVLYQD